MSASSTPYPQFVVATTPSVAGIVSATPYTALSVILGAGTYRVDGVINGVSSAGVASSFSVSAALVSASPLISLNIGLPDDYTSVDAPISFVYKSDGVAPLVITITAVFASGTYGSAARSIRFNKIQ